MTSNALRLQVDAFVGSLPVHISSLPISGTLGGSLASSPDAVVNVQFGDQAFPTVLSDGDTSLPRQWTTTVDTTSSHIGKNQLIIVAHAAHEVVSRRYELEQFVDRPEPPATSGHFDAPAHGDILDTDTLQIGGWCLFHESAVSKVEAVVNGCRVGRARCYTERPDVIPVYADRDAPVVGYTMLIPLHSLPAADEYLVSVEATSLDGRQWISDTRTVTPRAKVDAGGGPYAEVLRRRTRSLVDAVPPWTGDRRVAVVTHDLGYGGGQLWLSEMLRQFQLRNHFEIHVISVADGPLRAELEQQGIAVHVTSPPNVSTPHGHEDRVLELAMLMRYCGCSAVLVNTVLPFQAVEAAHVARLPIIWAIHESFPLTVWAHVVWGPHIHPYVLEQFAGSLRHADALVFEASQTAELFAAHSDPSRRFVIDYGVDVDAIDRYRESIDRAAIRTSMGWAPDDLVILVVGVFEARKAEAAIVAAFEELSPVHPELRLVLVGSHESPYSRCVATQVERARHGDRIQIEPITPDIYRWYAIADLLVCGSDIESLPRSILEAMAFELPVVSTDVFGVASLLRDGETGWLTLVNELSGLVGTLAHVVDLTPDERAEVAANARADVERRADDNSYGLVIADALDALMTNPHSDLSRLLDPRRARRKAAT
ncbi:MAG: glycosyltransferase family 4 protein [Actinomycetota bacterium]